MSDSGRALKDIVAALLAAYAAGPRPIADYPVRSMAE